jgi:cysteine-rich repeat protein
MTRERDDEHRRGEQYRQHGEHVGDGHVERCAADGRDAPSTGPAGSSTGEPGFDPPTPACGNGYLEATEECDDGNWADGDGCNAACQVPCGLELELLELAPTAQSAISGVQVAAAPDGGFVVVGRVREITVDQEQQTTVGPRQILVTAYDVSGEPRWQQKVGDAMGDLYGERRRRRCRRRVFLVGSVDGADASDIWIGKLAADDGAELWTRVADGSPADGDDFGGAITVAGANEVVAVGQIRDKLDDTDVWVRKLTASDGATLWTTTWSGVPGGLLARHRQRRRGRPRRRGPRARARVRQHRHHRGDAPDLWARWRAPLWTASPLADGSKHKHSPGPLAVGPDGELVLGVTRGGFAPTFWIFRLAPGRRQPTWSLWPTTSSRRAPTGASRARHLPRRQQPRGRRQLGRRRLTTRLRVGRSMDGPPRADGQKRCQVSYQAPGGRPRASLGVREQLAAGAAGLRSPSGAQRER